MHPQIILAAVIWYVGWSTISWLQFRSDKRRARAKEWRIPEITLLQTAALGGWPGAWYAVRRFRHKSMKQSFQIQLFVATMTNFALLLMVMIALNL